MDVVASQFASTSVTCIVALAKRDWKKMQYIENFLKLQRSLNTLSLNTRSLAEIQLNLVPLAAT